MGKTSRKIKKIDYRNYKPSDLGTVSFIEVVSLEMSQNERNGMLVRFADPKEHILDALERGNPSFLANGKDAQTIAKLFRQLPPAEMTRCHLPPYGVKFHLSNSKCVSVTLCWKCDNAVVWFSDTNMRTSFTFDAQSKPAQKLLEIFRGYLPSGVA